MKYAIPKQKSIFTQQMKKLELFLTVFKTPILKYFKISLS